MDWLEKTTQSFRNKTTQTNMTEPPKDDIYTTVYKHLYSMNEHIVSSIFPTITPELKAIISHDAYAEMIQMAQAGYLGSYYDRLIKNAV